MGIRDDSSFRDSATQKPKKPDYQRVVTFMAPDMLGDDPHNDYFEVSLPHMGRGQGIRMVPLRNIWPGDNRTPQRLDLGMFVTGLMENQNFFPVDQYNDGVDRDIYVPEGMGPTLTQRWSNEQYILCPAHPGKNNSLLGMLLTTHNNYGDLNWLFNVMLSRADIVAKLGFNQEQSKDREPRAANSAEEKPERDKWLDFAGTVWRDTIHSHRNDDRSERYRDGPITPMWAVAGMRLPQGDAMEFLNTPVNLLAMYSALLK